MQRCTTETAISEFLGHTNASTTCAAAATAATTTSSTPCSKKVVHQAHIDNLVNSQRIFKILSLRHSAENLL